jgi:hypothetical protein
LALRKLTKVGRSTDCVMPRKLRASPHRS